MGQQLYVQLAGPNIVKHIKKLNVVTQEEKDLVLHDLCARLPYGVKGSVENHTGTFVVKTVFNKGEYIDGYFEEFNISRGYHVEEFKPYLRQMSSMTAEEEQEYRSLCAMQFDEFADATTTVYYFDTIESFDWLNKNMFDFRGLIPAGAAIEVTENNNPYESTSETY